VGGPKLLRYRKSVSNGCNFQEYANDIGGNIQMANMEAVYRYGSTDGEVVQRHEVGPDTPLPSVEETITVPGRDGARQIVVTAHFPPHPRLGRG